VICGSGQADVLEDVVIESAQIVRRSRRRSSLALCRVLHRQHPNPNTRRAYARACARFFAWCEEGGLTPGAIRPHDVATSINARSRRSRNVVDGIAASNLRHSVPSSKLAKLVTGGWGVGGVRAVVARHDRCGRVGHQGEGDGAA